MEYVYAAMLIHKVGGKLDEDTVKKVLEAAGAKPDEARIKALIAALQGVNIDEAIKKAASVPVAVASPSAEAKAEHKEEKKEDKKKTEEQAAAGLGALFG
ncbi:MAG: 50S ribosomal protein P1 [Candidatus Woesearchaeota archaeon]|nr:50S ribosomal protein P1 [Candidatus Woesearchaeota archaeon]